jgi:hypothetical protein
MRVLALSLALLALPAAAADRTEEIRLQYISAGDLMTFLLPRPAHEQGGGLGGPDRPRGLVPVGIAGLATPSAGVLSASGSEEAIQQLRNIIRLVDIPRRRIRLSVRLIEPQPEELNRIVKDVAVGKADGSAVKVGVLDEDGRNRILARAQKTLLQADLVCANGATARLLWPEDPSNAAFPALTPRVNGDGTITLTVPARPDPAAKELIVLRRISSGQTLVVAREEGGPTLVVTAEVLPDEKPQTR